MVDYEICRFLGEYLIPLLGGCFYYVGGFLIYYCGVYLRYVAVFGRYFHVLGYFRGYVFLCSVGMRVRVWYAMWVMVALGLYLVSDLGSGLLSFFSRYSYYVISCYLT